jgi:hypothetical protein
MCHWWQIYCRFHGYLWQFATGGIDIGGKLAAGIVDTGGKFATSINDTSSGMSVKICRRGF